MRSRRTYVLLALLVIATALLVLKPHISRWIPTIMDKAMGRATVADRVDQYGADVRARLAPAFEKAAVSFPPDRLLLVAFKTERVLEVYAGDTSSVPRFIASYPIVAASGKAGPKLREGDQQVPEGFYRVESLNPNSRFHLALRLDYPNAFDRETAAAEGRTNLGTDIMIHGGAASIGCIALGDQAAEDLFILAALTGLDNVTVIITPADFRRGVTPASLTDTPWLRTLYERLAKALPE